MQYDQSCLDRKEYFPELVKIDKESLIRQTFDSSVAGSSSVTSLRGELKLCERAQERIKDKEKLDHCVP